MVLLWVKLSLLQPIACFKWIPNNFVQSSSHMDGNCWILTPISPQPACLSGRDDGNYIPTPGSQLLSPRPHPIPPGFKYCVNGHLVSLHSIKGFPASLKNMRIIQIESEGSSSVSSRVLQSVAAVNRYLPYSTAEVFWIALLHLLQQKTNASFKQLLALHWPQLLVYSDARVTKRHQHQGIFFHQCMIHFLVYCWRVKWQRILEAIKIK